MEEKLNIQEYPGKVDSVSFNLYIVYILFLSVFLQLFLVKSQARVSFGCIFFFLNKFQREEVRDVRS